MNPFSINVNSFRLVARGYEAGGSVGARSVRKLAAYLAINREMPRFAAAPLATRT